MRRAWVAVSAVVVFCVMAATAVEAAATTEADEAGGARSVQTTLSDMAGGRVPLSDASGWDWSSIDAMLDEAVTEGVFPGTVVLIGDATGVAYLRAVGNFTYGLGAPENDGTNPAMDAETTIFDAASLTKVISTTSAVAQFYQRGELSLETPVVDILGPAWDNHGKGEILVLNCMLHDAGFPPDPVPNFWMPAFGCPQTTHYHPKEDFSCQDKVYEGVMNQFLVNPVGAKYVYSDLSMMTMMYVVGTLARDLHYVTPADLYPGCDQGGPGALQCYYEAYVRKYVFAALDMTQTGFLPPQSQWQLAAPTENDTVYLHRVIQGQVSDGNAYASGGIQGHAGLFTNPLDAYTLVSHILNASPGASFYNTSTAKLFTTTWNATFSPRAIGWDTNAPSNQIRSCLAFSDGVDKPGTFLHEGYTGTQICADKCRPNKPMTALFTNRVYPTALNIKIRQFRQQFNSQVIAIWDKHMPSHCANHLRDSE